MLIDFINFLRLERIEFFCFKYFGERELIIYFVIMYVMGCFFLFFLR